MDAGGMSSHTLQDSAQQVAYAADFHAVPMQQGRQRLHEQHFPHPVFGAGIHSSRSNRRDFLVDRVSPAGHMQSGPPANAELHAIRLDGGASPADGVSFADHVQSGPAGTRVLVHTPHTQRPSSVRILVMSDTHGLHRTLEQKYPLQEADILVHTGDFTDRGTDEEFADFNNWLGELRPRFKFIVVIAGNHEWKAVAKAKQSSEIPRHIKDGTFLLPEYMRRRLSNATHVLHHELVDIMGIRFFGSSWCPWHPKEDLDDEHRAMHQPGLALALKKWLSSDRNHHFHRFDEIPNSVDVLLTHGPPKGILDLMEGTKNCYGSSAALRQSIEAKKPKVHLFGHCHEQRGCWIKQRDGSFQGGVEYQPAPGVPWFHSRGPPRDYPCQLIACTALKNHNGLDRAGSCLVAPARLILADGAPGSWSFRLCEPDRVGLSGLMEPMSCNAEAVERGRRPSAHHSRARVPETAGPAISSRTYQRWAAEDLF